MAVAEVVLLPLVVVVAVDMEAMSTVAARLINLVQRIIIEERYCLRSITIGTYLLQFPNQLHLFICRNR